ncbi:MAG: hypothetical protein Q4C10_03995 [Clostridia bacterium]|nr:hypothetical protein [Clostridia bacterium]
MKKGNGACRRAALLAVVLLLAALLLGGCRFQVVETGEVLIQAPTEAPAE